MLTPVARGENNYRYYAPEQLAVVNLIRTCQELGIKLADIKKITEHRTPGQINELLSAQIEKIDGVIQDWVNAKALLSYFKSTIESVLDVNTDEVTIQNLPEQAMVLGAPNDYSKGRNDYDALLNFYHAQSKQNPDLNLNYPVWGYFEKESIEKGKWFWPDRYYFSNPEGSDLRPAGLYAVGYDQGGYGNHDGVFKSVTDFITASGYKISGPAYAEYPLNEISVSDPKKYLMRVMIKVEKTKANLQP